MHSILGVDVQPTNYDEVVSKCITWAQHGESRALVFANVHVIMEAYDDPELRSNLNSVDVINPDGVPLVWALKLLGNSKATRVYGPDCTLALLKAAEAQGISIAFYGGSEAVLGKLLDVVRGRFPRLNIATAISPPFRPTTALEDETYLREIMESGARIVFIGLGCPKQERWMLRHYRKIPSVMLAVGAAFDFIAETKQQAPRWMMRCGLEWMFRLVSEPERLLGRYIRHNPRFLLYFAFQLLGRYPGRRR